MYHRYRFSTGTKLIKLFPSEALHKWIKTLATFHNEEIGDYLISVLKEHLPKEIKYDAATQDNQKDAKTKSDKARAKKLPDKAAGL